MPGPGLGETLRTLILDPPIATSEALGIGGSLRRRPEDFVVTELPAYEPDGQPGHFLLTLRKRGLSTAAAVQCVADHLEISAREIGVAGRKDKEAVTEQRISVPGAAADRLATFTHEAIELGEPRPHRHKLRMGHLQGNRFEIVIRDVALQLADAAARLRAKIELLGGGCSVDNVYGPQRFGADGVGLDRGLAALRRGRAGRRANMTVAAGQAGLFNLYTRLRRERDIRDKVVSGDLLQKTDTGGLFETADVQTDQQRLDSGAVVLTGPIFGSRMRSPTPGTAAAQLEVQTLVAAGIEPSALEALGRGARGTRRRLDLAAAGLHFEVLTDGVEPNGASRVAVRVMFTLPAGSYATRVCAELQQPYGVHAPGLQ